jgi:hypothetical protein
MQKRQWDRQKNKKSRPTIKKGASWRTGRLGLLLARAYGEWAPRRKREITKSRLALFPPKRALFLLV